MTAIAFEATTPRDAVGTELRAHVRDRLEEEYLLLCAVERPALLAALADDIGDGADAGVGRTLAILDYRLAAIEDFLSQSHDPHSDAVCTDCCVLLDRGDGPHWFLLAALSHEELPIIASDSALGRAMIGARTGETVQYPSPLGLETARVIALASGSSN